MFKKAASLVLICALFCTLGSASGFGRSPFMPADKLEKLDAPPAANGPRRAEAGKSLREEIAELVADARASKGLTIADPQNQPKQSNGLSKGAKIAIVAGVGAAVILAILFFHAKRHLFDGLTLGNR